MNLCSADSSTRCRCQLLRSTSNSRQISEVRLQIYYGQMTNNHCSQPPFPWIAGAEYAGVCLSFFLEHLEINSAPECDIGPGRFRFQTWRCGVR